MTTTCKYCNETEDKQDRPGLVCYGCMNFVHLACLRRPGTPGDFVCDVFFEFTCESCSDDNQEVFLRYKFPWVNVIYLSLNQLSTQSYGISHHGYFHYKTHICSFIDRSWQTLFGSSNKQKKNWVGTIAGVLSVYSKLFFKSGSATLGETGWWKLQHNFSPAVAAHIMQEIGRDKSKNRSRNQLSTDRNHFLAKISEMGYKELINPEEEEPVPCKKRRVDSADSALSTNSATDHLDSDSGRFETEEAHFSELMLAPNTDYYNLATEVDLKDFHPDPMLGAKRPQSDTSSVHSLSQQPALGEESDSRSGAEDKKPAVERRDKGSRLSLFSSQLNSVDLPWEYNFEKDDKTGNDDSIEKSKELVEMTQYEEIQLLKQVEGLIPRVRDPDRRAYLCRLRAKLALRRLKRHKHLPLFDLDRTVKILGGYVTEDPREVVNAERVLDRFQRSYLLDSLSGTVGAGQGSPLLARGSGAARSAYSGAALRPYIRRDAASTPLWIALTEELLTKTNKHRADYRLPPRGTIDYSYVRPEHVPAVNTLLAQFFWPGIDVTEALQYPEFSCVASYRRVAVGCAFLVPDSNPSEAYISFILTRPEWRRAGIATFMLYHLLQTCAGKSVTLHCSPTNPAIFLYQKFGFKVEELVQDFYEKYFDIDYKGCRHALFLRLAR